LKIEEFKIAVIMFISSLLKPKQKPHDLKKIEFSSSAQKMGITFTDKIRETFRRKWIKKS